MFFSNPAFFALLGALSLSAGSVAARRMMKEETDTWAATALNEIIGTAMVLASIAFLGVGFFAPANFDFAAVPPQAWIAMVASGALFAAIMYPTYKAYYYLEAAEVRLLTELINPWTILIGMVVFRETLTPQIMGGLALVLLGIALATFFNKSKKLSLEGVKLVLVVVFLSGLTSATDKYASPYFPPLVYAIATFAMPAAFAFCVVAARKSHVSHFFTYARRSWKISAIVAATNILAYFGVLVAYRTMPLSIASPIIGTNFVFSVLAGMWLLGETDGWQKKILGAVLALAGIAMLAQA